MVTTDDTVEEKEEKKPPVFKNPEFQHTAFRSSKKRGWRNLKQIISLERAHTWPHDAVHYSSIDAPPSFTPAKKYSDVSGLPSNYTDPLTKLRFADSSEFYRVRDLPMDIVNGLLELRKANSIVG
ncbi:INO80 complex subunit C-like [Eriocheir sinensis]|uniref:INO80 complex subunit C-like n=1 Tax=Eriocheir sinensis TaxID=95602 RepID=UPI0021C61D30|nr:INO80 complex subunit C-like [Eriocheir sinensis]XP_050688486.1 INO80 complex subunit C-like [Eriocheir sinensis]